MIAILSIHYQNWKKKRQFVSGNYCWLEQGFIEEFKIGIRLHFKQEALKSLCTGYLHVYTYIGWHALKIAFSQEWWAPVIAKLTILPLIFSKLLPSIILPFVFHEVSSFFFLFYLFFPWFHSLKIRQSSSLDFSVASLLVKLFLRQLNSSPFIKFPHLGHLEFFSVYTIFSPWLYAIKIGDL